MKQSALLSVTQQRMKHDFKYYVLNRLFIPYTKKRYIITDLHLGCIKTVMDNFYTLIEAYRGFGKSELISYAFILWRAEMWNESSLILSANENLAHMKLDLIRNSIESDNQNLHYMYSGDIGHYSWNRGEIHLIDKNNPRVMETFDSKGGQPSDTIVYPIKAKIFARSMFSISRGLHVDNIVGDDLVVEQNSSDFNMIQNTKNIFYRAIIPIRKPESRMIVVGTPQNENDLLQSLKKNNLFANQIIPALTERGESVCPELHSTSFIRQQEELMGPRSFQQEYLLQPVTDFDTDFTWEVLNKCRNFDIKIENFYDRKMNEKIFIGTDFSIKAEKQEAEGRDSDYFSLVAVLFDTETKKRRILNIHRERGIKFSQQISLAISWYYRYQANALCTEKHGFLDIFNQVAGEVAKDIIIEDTGTSSGKFDKIKGIPSMKWEWEKGLWEVPCGDELSLELSNILLAELNQGEKSRHDDVADATFRAEVACLREHESAQVKYTPSQEQVEERIINLHRVW